MVWQPLLILPGAIPARKGCHTESTGRRKSPLSPPHARRRRRACPGGAGSVLGGSGARFGFALRPLSCRGIWISAAGSIQKANKYSWTRIWEVRAAGLSCAVCFVRGRACSREHPKYEYQAHGLALQGKVLYFSPDVLLQFRAS